MLFHAAGSVGHRTAGILDQFCRLLQFLGRLLLPLRLLLGLLRVGSGRSGRGIRRLFGLLGQGIGNLSCYLLELALPRNQRSDLLRLPFGVCFGQGQHQLRFVVQLGLSLGRLSQVLDDRKE